MKQLLIILALFSYYLNASAQGCTSADITTGLVASYPFSSNANDASGNGNNGTVNGATLTTDRFGNANSAYDFDGQNDYIECANNSFEIFGSQQPSSFSIWFTLSEKSKIISFFSKGLHSAGAGGNRYVAIEYQGTLSRFAVTIYNASTLHNALATIDTNQLNINQWYHLAVIRNDSISIYLNGQQLSSTNDNSGWTIDYNSTIQNLPARWGVRNYTNPDTVGDAHHGKLDDIRVYNRALSSCDIDSLFNMPNPSPSPCTADITTGLVASYPFNTNANDASGNGNNGTVNGATLTTDRFGNANSAYSFNGSQYISIADNAVLNPATSMSVAAWLQTNTTYFNGGVVGKWNCAAGSGHEQYVLQLGNDTTGVPGYSGIYIKTSGNPQTQAINNPNYSDGNWHLIVGTWDGSFVKYYFDGNLLTQRAYSGTISSINQPLEIGRYACGQGGSQNYITGKIDDVRIYNRALTACDIDSLFNMPNPSTCTPVITNGLVAYYPFCGDANDGSGNGNNGTVNGATLTSDRFGNPNSAYAFNGVSDYIDIPNQPNLNINIGQSFSVSLWIKHNGINSAKYFLSKYNGTMGVNPSYAFGTQDVNNPGGPYSWFEAAGFSQENRDNSTVLTDGNWHHYVCVYNSGISIKLYIDNQLTVTNNISYSNSIVNGLDLVIGAGANLQQFYSGSIDDIAIYNRALTQSEIDTLNNSLPHNCEVPLNLSTTNITNTSAQMNWTTATADSFMIRYTIHGTNTTAWRKIPGQPAVTSYTVTGLNPGTQYDWLVRSLCSGGGSNYQAVAATFTTLSASTPCITPYDLGASSITNTTATISWTNLVTADTFRIRYSENGTANFRWKDVNGAGGSSTGLAALSPNTTYQFQVASRCLGVSTPYSTSFIFTTANSAVSCVTPFGTSTTNITGTTADVNWTNLVTADTFRVRYSINGTANFRWKDVNGTGGVTGTQLTGLSASSTYQWQVRTKCTGVAYTPYSASVIFSTPAPRISESVPENNLIDVTVFPNPAHNNLTVSFNASKENTGRIFILDLSGRELITRNLTVKEGENISELDVSDLSKGIYVVAIESEGMLSKRIKVIIE